MATFPNGRIPTAQLTALPASWSNKNEVEYLRSDAAASLSRALSRAVAESGENFQLFDAYRSFTEQVAILKRYYRAVSGARRPGDRSLNGVTYRKRDGMPAAASPGHSNHGTGTAIDIHHGGIQRWFQTKGRSYGWTWDEGKKLGEAWHFVYDPDLDQHKGEGTLDHAAVQRVVGAAVDGKIGTGTVAKIKAWQVAHGLEGDGKVGPDTKRAMGLTAGTPAAPAPATPTPAPAAQVKPDDTYVLERHQTKNLHQGRVDKKRGLTGKLNAITIHHWGSDGQRFDNVVSWLVADGNGNNSSSAHEVIEGGRVAVLASIQDGTWNSGSPQGNLDNYALECRPEADLATLRTVAARIAAIRKEAGWRVPLNMHQDYTSTACPGRYVALLATLDALADGKAVPAPAVPSKPAAGAGRLKVDGRLGKDTVRALQRFLNSRTRAGLAVDGRAAESTWAALQEFLGAPYVDGQISRQSHRATALGNGVVDRKSAWEYTGPNSRGSQTVKLLQKWVGVKADGVWGEKTTAALQRKLNDHKVGM